MTSVHRKIFLFFFVVLFFLTAPVVVLYALGYRFDGDHKIFVHSGSVTIESWPRDVDIYLNGEKQEKKQVNSINNSFTVNGLKPGKYHLKCQKDGYTSWEKNIEVHSGLSTEFWNVLLYPVNNPEVRQFSTDSVEQFFLSPRDNDELVFFSQNDTQRKVSLLNIRDHTHEEIYSTDKYNFLDPSDEENVEWSTDNKQILIPMSEGDEKNYIIARIKKDRLNNILDLKELFGHKETEFESVRWMFDRDNELVILTKDHRLFYFFLDEPEATIQLDDNVSAFNFAGNRIYYTQLPNNLVWEIKDYDIATKRQITNISVASQEDEFIELIVYDEYRLAMINQKKQLFVYNEEKEKSEKFFSEVGGNVEGIQFSNDGKKMLYWTNNEIWTLMLRDWDVQPTREKNVKLMSTRFSQPIHNVQWMDNYENILFTAGDQVKSVELDSRDRINMVDVDRSGEPLAQRDLFYNKNNQMIFYRNKVGSVYLLRSVMLIDKSGLFGF